MARLQLITLGRTELMRPDGRGIRSVLSQPKRFALLVYLAIEASDGFIRRDKVAALFWPEHDQADARANLRKSLYFLRRSLGPDVIVTRGDEEIGIDPERLACDVVTLLSGGTAPVEGPFLDAYHFSGASNDWEAWREGIRDRVRARVPEDRHDPASGPPGAGEPSGRPGPDRASSPAVTDRAWRIATFGALAIAGVLGVAWAFGLLGPEQTPAPTRYDRIRLGTGAQFPAVVQRHYALPPDGSGILFLDDVAGVSGSWWKPLGEVEATYLDGLDLIVGPSISPDGRWVAFTRDARLFAQPLEGGASVVLSDSASLDFSPGVAWLPDGDLLFEGRDHGLYRSNRDGGTPELVAAVEEVGEVFHVSPLPDGRRALVVGCDGLCEETTAPTLSLVDLERRTVEPLHSGVWMAWPMSDERLVMVDGQGIVSAAPFDADRATLGHPVPLLDGVRVSPFPDVVLGEDGSLLYIPGDVEPAGQRLVWMSRDGVQEVVDPEWPPWGRVRSLSLSPDGHRLAVGMRGGEAVGERIWIKELPDGPLTPLTAAATEARRPIWGPDQRTVAFVVQADPDSSLAGTVQMLPTDASVTRPVEVLRHAEPIFEVVMTDGWKTAIVRVGNAATGDGDIALRRMDGGHAWEAPFESAANEHSLALSPDGRWLAYVSELSGRREVYVRPVPGPGPRVQVSTDGGVEPRWARSGAEIFYRTPRLDEPPGAETVDLVAARVRTDPRFEVISRDRLFFTTGFEPGNPVPLYDVSEDDRRFLMVTRFTPRGWTHGEVVYSRGWYWSDQVQARLRR